MNKNRFQSNQTYFTICIYTLFVILAGCIIFRVVYHWDSTLEIIKSFFTSMSSFVAGILIAFMVNPLVLYIYKKLLKNIFHIKSDKICKFLSILIAYTIVIGFIVICLFYVIPQLISSISDLSANIPLMYMSFSRWLRITAYKNEYINNTLINNFINNMSPRMMELSTTIASKVIPLIYSASIAILKWFVMIIIAIFVSIYLLADKKIIFRTIKKMLYAFFSKDIAESIINIAKDSNTIFTGYIIAKSIDSLIIGILCCIIMGLLHLPYAILISVIVGITNMIPYFGPYIGAIPGTLILTVMNYKYGIIFLIMILALQQFDGLILGPKLLSTSTGLRPIIILFAITFGGAYAGILGMFLGVPIVAVIQYLLNLLVNKQLKKKQIDI